MSYKVFLLDVYKFNLEYKSCVRLYVATGTLLAVTKVVRNEELVLVTYAHQLQTLGPTLDYT